ncbi:MAG TPA: squalene--hopene cyclase [Pirellulales bacterium]|jgi:squalene-hopene/tetraprenyl-beta-curcumene cyclase
MSHPLHRDRHFRRGALLRSLSLALALAAFMVAPAAAQKDDEPVTLENVGNPGKNDPEEPLADKFSAAKAVRYLDIASVGWQKTFGCMTCHTNYLYLLSRPNFSSGDPAHRTVREYAEKLVSDRWPAKGPRWDAEVVMTAATLAGNDAQTTGKLHPLTKQALDKMWTVQRDDGGFDWYKVCHWPPYEDDDYFGATMAALGVGMAPEKYAQTPAAQAGIKKLREYFAANPPPSLHHRAFLLWASTYLPELMDKAQQKECVDALLALQHEDGGWGIAQLGTWERRDKTPQDTAASDGYGAGFVVFIARRAGVPASDPRLTRGVEWLKTHQRKSGRWFTRSVFCDRAHYISNAGTSFAIMALAECDALEAKPK